jgi:integrase
MNGEGGLPKGFTDKWVKNAPPPAYAVSKDGRRQVSFFETLRRGLTLELVCSYGETKTWRALIYENGKPRSQKLGAYPGTSLKEARDAARTFHENPQEYEKRKAEIADHTFKVVAENWLTREKKDLRSKREIERYLGIPSKVTKRKARTTVYLPQKFTERPISEIRRRDLTDLLDTVEDKHGTTTADRLLGVLRQVMHFHELRDDTYRSPIIRGMKRDRRRPEERSRRRILSDDELRAVWKASEREDMGAFGAIVRLCLLTGQRSRRIATMKWADFDGQVWTVPMEAREKGTGGELLLPETAVTIIEAQRSKRIAKNPYVFAVGIRRGAFNSFSEGKAKLDKKLPKKMPAWVVHDLRRTARSLLARAGVRPDYAERVLGHVVGGVEGVYDRHAYRDEKASALRALASLIDTIVNPPDADNVVPLHQERAHA